MPPDAAKVFIKKYENTVRTPKIVCCTGSGRTDWLATCRRPMPQKLAILSLKKRPYKKSKLSIDTPTCQESKDLRPPGETPCLGGPLPPRSSYFWIWALWLSHTPALRRGGGDGPPRQGVSRTRLQRKYGYEIRLFLCFSFLEK